MRHDLTLSDGPFVLRPLTEADIAPLMALAAEHPGEYAQMGTSPIDFGYYTAALDAPDQLPFVSLVDGAVRGQHPLHGHAPRAPAAGNRQHLAGPGVSCAAGPTAPSSSCNSTHAFEVMGMRRVEIKTDLVNERSQTAIAALGAVREGVLRKHMVRTDGSDRDTVMFSITDDGVAGSEGATESRTGKYRRALSVCLRTFSPPRQA